MDGWLVRGRAGGAVIWLFTSLLARAQPGLLLVALFLFLLCDISTSGGCTVWTASLLTLPLTYLIIISLSLLFTQFKVNQFFFGAIGVFFNEYTEA